MANINISTGIIPNTQVPLDGKAYFRTFEQMNDFGTGDHKVFTYYEGLIAFCLEDESLYIWAEVNPSDPISNDPRQPVFNTYTYPNGLIQEEIDYSERVFSWRKYVQGSANISENMILSGTIERTGERTYESTEFIYVIQGEVYHALPRTFVLDPIAGGIDFKRKDLFALSTQSEIVVFQGAESIDPQEPDFPIESHIKVRTALVTRQFIEPDIQREVIYDEGTGPTEEWSFLGLSSTISPLYNSPFSETEGNQYKGQACIESVNQKNTDLMVFTKTGNYNITGSTNLVFYFKSKRALNCSILIELYNGSRIVRSKKVRNNEFGYNASFVSGYVMVKIPLSSFIVLSSGNMVNKLVMSWLPESGIFNTNESSPYGFYIDYIHFEKRNPGPGLSTEPITQPSNPRSFFSLNEVSDNSLSGLAGKVPMVSDDESNINFVSVPTFDQLYQGNFVLSGGVSHISGDNFLVWANSYFINGHFYNDIPVRQTIQISSSNPSFPRIDSFRVRRNEGIAEIIYSEGIPSSDPHIFPLGSNEALIGSKLIKANTDIGSEIETIVVYQEALNDPDEFDIDSIPTHSEVAETSDSGNRYIRIGNGINRAQGSLILNSHQPHFVKGFFLTMMMRADYRLSEDDSIIISLYCSGTRRGSFTLTNRNLSSYTSLVFGDWGYFSIPVSLFNSFFSEIDQIDSIHFDCNVSTKVLIDNIYFKSGIPELAKPKQNESYFEEVKVSEPASKDKNLFGSIFYLDKVDSQYKATVFEDHDDSGIISSPGNTGVEITFPFNLNPLMTFVTIKSVYPLDISYSINGNTVNIIYPLDYDGESVSVLIRYYNDGNN